MVNLRYVSESRVMPAYQGRNDVCRNDSFKRKTFFVRAFRLRAIEIWNNLDNQYIHQVSVQNCCSLVR